MPAASEASALQPRAYWTYEANEARRAELAEDKIKAYTPTQHFRRDFMAYCKLQGVVPHPCILPFHPDEEEHAPELSAAVQYDMTDVEHIKVKHWCLDTGSLFALCWALPHAPTMNELYLYDVHLNAQQLVILCTELPKSHVRVLHLDWNPIDPASVVPNSSNDLEKLPNDSEDEEVASADRIFAKLIGEGSILTYLSLRGNGIMASGARAIAQGLRHNTTLESLNLFNNNLHDEGAIALAHALPFNKTLRSLSIANNHLSGHGALAMIHAITKYIAPPSLLKELEESESRIQAEIDLAKKAKKKIDRATAMANLGLPMLETIDGNQYAPGNRSIAELVLSGNDSIALDDVLAMSDELSAFRATLQSHLKKIKLQRIPSVRSALRDAKVLPDRLSEFITI